jgi:ABC-type Fe3+/spermidine/putrescine transport system ATPase subunit
MAVEVEVINVTKRFGDVVAVDDVSFEVMKNEFFSLLGPSGCGKTTTLSIIAGLEELDAGTVKLGGEVVNNVPSHKRHVGMVFQGLALFPHMSVFDNIAFGLKMYKFPLEEIEDRVKKVLASQPLPSCMRAKRVKR